MDFPVYPAEYQEYIEKYRMPFPGTDGPLWREVFITTIRPILPAPA